MHQPTGFRVQDSLPAEGGTSFHPQRRGGLIRTAVKVDLKKERINDLLITGDFFIHPRRAIYDLEAALKNTQVNQLKSRIENFFLENQVEILGLH